MEITVKMDGEIKRLASRYHGIIYELSEDKK
jgi:hypothetical protein